jgi:type IV secretory pathway TrbD component
LGYSKSGCKHKRHCERSAAIHVLGAKAWIATAYGLAMTRWCRRHRRWAASLDQHGKFAVMAEIHQPLLKVE